MDVKHTFTKNKLRILILSLILSVSPCLFHRGEVSAGDIRMIGAVSLEKEIAYSKSKVLIVDFWATFCTPCKQQVPVYSLIQTKYRPDDVSIIGVSLDFDKNRAKNFVQVQEIKYPVFLGEEELGFHFNVNSLPTTHIYNDERKLVKSYVGLVGEDELTQTIEKLLIVH